MTPLVCELTDREEEVVRLLSEGLEYRGVARRLGISHNTVREHVQNGCRKTGAINKTHLVALYNRGAAPR